MINADDIKLYLPKYLSDLSQESLFYELKKFPSNDPNQYYVSFEDKVIYQGDALKNIPFISLPDTNINYINVIVISNTCDIDLSNTRIFPAFISYCPLIDLERYRLLLLKHSSETKVTNHLSDIKAQRITQIMYFPKGALLDKEYITFFDRTLFLKNAYIDRNQLQNSRIFSLSNFGYYLFLLKLSIHFTRIRDGVDRVNNNGY